MNKLQTRVGCLFSSCRVDNVSREPKKQKKCACFFSYSLIFWLMGSSYLIRNKNPEHPHLFASLLCSHSENLAATVPLVWWKKKRGKGSQAHVIMRIQALFFLSLSLSSEMGRRLTLWPKRALSRRMLRTPFALGCVRDRGKPSLIYCRVQSVVIMPAFAHYPTSNSSSSSSSRSETCVI